jgi:putative SOS response-associated peptidase YedK
MINARAETLREKPAFRRLFERKCCMIPVDVTTRPNEVVANIHDRMPVILRQVDEDLWLDRERFDPDLLQSLLVPFDPGQMRAYPVPTIVGSPTNDTPECMEEVAWQ